MMCRVSEITSQVKSLISYSKKKAGKLHYISPWRLSVAGETTAARCQNSMPDVDSVFEMLGGFGIAIAAATWSALVQVRASKAAMLTLAVCLVVLAPFLLVASTILLFGLACCLPVMITGFTIAWFPAVVRTCRAAANTIRAWLTARLESDALQQFLLRCQANPLITVACVVGILSCLPLVVVTLCVSGFFFLLFSPIIVPAAIIAYCFFLGASPTAPPSTAASSAPAPATPPRHPAGSPPRHPSTPRSASKGGEREPEVETGGRRPDAAQEEVQQSGSKGVARRLPLEPNDDGLSVASSA